MADEERYKEFEQYLTSGEPGVEERARNWSIAIGLQDVDGLKPSEFLLEQAKANIEGRISSAEVGRRLEEYYSQKSVREKAEADGTLQADNVSDRINLLLEEKAFVFSPMELSRIHGFLFKGILPHAGQFRTYNITKNQWILDGETIEYGSAGSLMKLLTFDFAEEKKFDYSAVSSTEAIRHIVRFISDIWQIHAFGEGNTRTTAVFLIKYLRSFGFEVNNESFEKHSWFFRNALVRSQYENIPKGVHRTFEPLERFMNFTVFGIPADLRNRTLHIRWTEPLRRDGVLEEAKCQNDVSETPISLNERLSLKEMAVMQLIMADSKISIASITSKTGLSRRTVDRVIATLKEKGILVRQGAKNNATWTINFPKQ
ncbi:Fic family protein [uncultured Muribaculum sp.]|uniref:Fic family protein n=1 Tax=uncultured Muribaculum sp. TaxID=1918613 RepID=UPI00272BC7F7|nr:Fic family protein [uncultured Muribaculum sp.]